MNASSLLAALALSLGASNLQDRPGQAPGPFLEKVPPALEIPADGWLNAERSPSLEALRGKVVWLEFSFST